MHAGRIHAKPMFTARWFLCIFRHAKYRFGANALLLKIHICEWICGFYFRWQSLEMECSGEWNTRPLLVLLAFEWIQTLECHFHRPKIEMQIDLSFNELFMCLRQSHPDATHGLWRDACYWRRFILNGCTVWRHSVQRQFSLCVYFLWLWRDVVALPHLLVQTQLTISRTGVWIGFTIHAYAPSEAYIDKIESHKGRCV